MLKKTVLILFTLVFISSLSFSQEQPKEVKNKKECASKECCKKDSTKGADCTKMEGEHPKECKCEKCAAHANMDHSKMEHGKMMKDSHPENCDCKMCKAHAEMKDGQMMDKKHPADCKCEMCEAHAKMMDGEKKACGPDCKKECCSKSEKATETSSIWNKYCPVRGEEIDADSPTVEYMGKTIGFCCPGCDKKFSENPEKYMKNLSEDGQKFEAKS